MQIVSLHDVSKQLFSRKIKKNVISLSSAEYAHSLLSVNKLMICLKNVSVNPDQSCVLTV